MMVCAAASAHNPGHARTPPAVITGDCSASISRSSFEAARVYFVTVTITLS
jgi:hypothetical protein